MLVSMQVVSLESIELVTLTILLSLGISHNPCVLDIAVPYMQIAGLTPL
jgi:hypothetical protein